MANQLNRGNINPAKIAEARSLQQTTRGIKNFASNQTAIDRNANPNLFNSDLYSHVPFQRDANGNVARWPHRGTLQQVLNPVNEIGKDGLADMGTNGVLAAEDQKFDNLRYYADGEVANLGKAHLGGDFFAYLERKKQLEMWKNFQMFKMNLVDLSTPARRKWWAEKQPELFQKKMDYYHIQTMIEGRRKEIEIRGVQDEADLLFMFLLEKGFYLPSSTGNVNDYLPDEIARWVEQLPPNALANTINMTQLNPTFHYGLDNSQVNPDPQNRF